MKHILKYSTLIFILTIAITACKSNDKATTNLGDLSWMLGNWENSFEEGAMLEEWAKENDSLFTGRGFMFMEGAEIPSEELRIEQRAEGIFYIAIPVNQTRTEFKLTESLRGKATFENPEHDFPNKIEYAMMGRDSLYARVSGKDGDTEKAFELFFARKK